MCARNVRVCVCVCAACVGLFAQVCVQGLNSTHAADTKA